MSNVQFWRRKIGEKKVRRRYSGYGEGSRACHEVGDCKNAMT